MNQKCNQTNSDQKFQTRNLKFIIHDQASIIILKLLQLLKESLNAKRLLLSSHKLWVVFRYQMISPPKARAARY